MLARWGIGSTATLGPDADPPVGSVTSSLIMRMRPDETCLPIVEGSSWSLPGGRQIEYFSGCYVRLSQH
jgi:hypothetical protein